MKKIYILCATALWFSTLAIAQQSSINISVYNTGARFELRRAPFGSQTPQLDSVKSMVFAKDTFETKKNPLEGDFKAPSSAEIKAKIEANKPNPNSSPKKPTEADITKVKQNAAKRSCIIETSGLKGKIVLIDFDKNCDPAEKCLQAQRAGAYAAIVIYDNNKKDEINMAKSKVSDAVKIPCFSIIRQQGDSLSAMLPSKAVFFTPRPEQSALMRDSIQNTPFPETTSMKLASNEAKTIQEALISSEGNTLKTYIQLSPNPSNETVNVQFALSKMSSLAVEVRNVAGQVIYTQKLDNIQVGTLDILTQNWANGLYWLHLDYLSERIVKKLVVQH